MTDIPYFRLGRLVITPNAQAVLENDEVMELLKRHQNGDWGDMCSEDRETNELAVKTKHGGRVFSAYDLSDERKIWVITEADRSVTTLLLPEDY